MIPVWPVARKSASTPRASKAAGDRQRGVFLAQRAVGADGQQALAGPALTPVPIGMPAGGTRTSNSRRPSCGRLRRQLGMVVEPHVHAADDVEPGFERLDQRRDPGRADEAAAIGDADHDRARALRAPPRPASAGQAGGHASRSGSAYSPTHFSGAQSRRPERGLGIAGLGRSRRGTGDRGSAGRSGPSSPLPRSPLRPALA